MLKIEIINEHTNLEVVGNGKELLAEGVLLVYVMARHFEGRSHDVAEVYRKLLVDALTDDDFFKLVGSGIDSNSEGIENDVPF